MSTILLCGLNGSGKTTLGKELAKNLNYKFLNDEDYYFIGSDIPFSKSRVEKDARNFALSYIKKYKNVVITATRGDLGNEINALYDYVIYLSAPAKLRLSRVKMRDIDRFGERVREGGDMHEQQQKFYGLVETRTTKKIEEWLETLSCKVLRLDGTRPIAENVKLIKEMFQPD